MVNQFNFASVHMRQNQMIQLSLREGCGFPSNIGVMWPERLIYKINKRTGEKKVLLERKLSLFKLYDQFLPLTKMGAPILAKQGCPMDFLELVP